MTATLAEIMDELADQIRAAMETVTDVDVQVEPRLVLNPTPPTIDIYPGDPSSEPTLRAYGDLLGAEILTVRARVATAAHAEGQDLLLALMDDEDDLSIVQAIHTDRTLNGLASDLDCRERTGFLPAGDIDGALLSVMWSVLVIKAHS